MKSTKILILNRGSAQCNDVDQFESLCFCWTSQLLYVDSFKKLDEEIGRKPVDKEGQGLAEESMYQVQNSI